MLEVDNLTKTYGALSAVEHLSLTLQRGDVLGFVGPNGAGKTTTIKIAATLLDATEGTVRVCGVDVLEDPYQIRKMIGYMPDFFGVYDDLKVWEYLDFFASAYRLPPAERAQASRDVLEITDLAPKRDSYVESLSRGMKQRLCLAKTLLHNPELLILDEPASGLDPRARVEFKEIIKDLREMGKTILVSSHILPELADFCNKIAVIEAGRLIVAGPVRDITAALQEGRKIHIRVLERQEEALAEIAEMPGVASAAAQDGRLIVTYTGPQDSEHEIVKRLVQAGFRVLSFSPAEMNLEDAFMRLTKGIVQ
ncbi:MAG: ABC transporter ATP-binding protein [Armatimonadetes bacterium]|nr:ABC transporter ATP-binding protein [Armatimonadota bacterium]